MKTLTQQEHEDQAYELLTGASDIVGSGILIDSAPLDDNWSTLRTTWPGDGGRVGVGNNVADVTLEWHCSFSRLQPTPVLPSVSTGGERSHNDRLAGL